MNETRYQVLVNGRLIEGISEQQARQNMAALFKVAVEKIEPMFSGRKLAIKKGLSKEAALKYKAAINQAGMLAGIASMDTAPAVAQTADTTTSHPTSLAPPGSIVDDTPQPPPASIDTHGLSMGETGITLDETPPPAPPELDTKQFSVAAVGEDVAEQVLTPEPEIDISALSTAEVGAIVDDTPPPPPARIDTSQLSVAAVGEDVGDRQKIPAANIDTSKLSLDERSGA